jgi:hypothetical protein
MCLIAGGWWFARRGDSRFVGRWELTKPYLSHDPSLRFVEFHSDGRLSSAFIGSESWTTVGSTLFLGAKSDRQHWKVRLLWWHLNRLAGRRAPTGNAYRILEVTPDRIELGGMDGGYPYYTYTRINE